MSNDVSVGTSRTWAAPAPAPATQRPAATRQVYRWAPVALIGLGFLLRLGLIAQGWPQTNSDEGTMGVMALHIAYHGAHPIFYYGQNYMGPHQAVLGAVLFRVFGASLFTLRLGLLLLVVAFLGSSYLFTRLVYGAGWATLCLAVLALGSPFVLARELSAIGGYTETLLFGSLLFLLAGWLIVSYRPEQAGRGRRWRIAAYAAWGVTAGTSIWSDLLGAPFVLMSGVVLAVVCWRELVRLGAPLATLAGLAVGLFPVIYYNLRAAPGQDSLSTVNAVRGAPPATLLAQLHAVWRAVGISVPMITGEPFCQANELPVLGPTTSYSRSCILVRDVWGAGYLVLLALAVVLACWGLWRLRRRPGRAGGPAGPGPADEVRRGAIHLALLGSAVISFLLYADSGAPVDWPGIHARYLIGFLIATPALLWPVGQGVLPGRRPASVLRRPVRVVCVAALAAYCVLLTVGVVNAYRQVPPVQAGNRRDATLIDTLVRHHVRHFYSDYWTCNKITFLAGERVVCAVVNGKLDDALNRYHPYWDATTADPRAAYVFPVDSSYVRRTGDGYTSPPVDRYARPTANGYRTLVSGGYLIYLTR